MYKLRHLFVYVMLDFYCVRNINPELTSQIKKKNIVGIRATTCVCISVRMEFESFLGVVRSTRITWSNLWIKSRAPNHTDQKNKYVMPSNITRLNFPQCKHHISCKIEARPALGLQEKLLPVIAPAALTTSVWMRLS